jgi:peptide/nickel transport system ATP-binding protein
MLEVADGGSIEFAGTNLLDLGSSELRRTRRDLQLMFQDPYASLDPRMRVGSIIREPLQVQGLGTDAEQKARVLELLDDVGLAASAAQRYPHEFSGGQRQRIGFARALALEPKLIVADEPVSALDVSIQAQLLNLMKDLQQRLGLTMVLVSHDLAVMRYMASTIGVMYLGKLVEVGPASAVLSNPVHPYSQGLLDAVPVPDVAEARLRRGRQISGELPSPVDPPSGCRFRTRCPRAEERCAVEEPEFRDFEGGSRAACHFPLSTPVVLHGSAQRA